MIFYTNLRLVNESLNRTRRLVEVMHDLDLIAERFGWKRLVVTSIYRTLEENRAAKAKSIVHCVTPHRAADIRVWGMSAKLLQQVVTELNARWQYDPTRPRYPVAYSEPHGTGPHLHVQVHPNTRRVA